MSATIRNYLQRRSRLPPRLPSSRLNLAERVYRPNSWLPSFPALPAPIQHHSESQGFSCPEQRGFEWKATKETKGGKVSLKRRRGADVAEFDFKRNAFQATGILRFVSATQDATSGRSLCAF